MAEKPGPEQNPPKQRKRKIKAEKPRRLRKGRPLTPLVPRTDAEAK